MTEEAALHRALQRVAELSAPTEVEEAEEAWIGGVADFGDREAAVAARHGRGYFDYISDVRDILREELGESFLVWRLMSMDALEEWASGSPVGDLSTSLDRRVCEKFAKFAAHGDGSELRVVAVRVTPEDVVMRGHPSERELVIDGDELDFACSVCPSDDFAPAKLVRTP